MSAIRRVPVVGGGIAGLATARTPPSARNRVRCHRARAGLVAPVRGCIYPAKCVFGRRARLTYDALPDRRRHLPPVLRNTTLCLTDTLSGREVAGSARTAQRSQTPARVRTACEHRSAPRVPARECRPCAVERGQRLLERRVVRVLGDGGHAVARDLAEAPRRPPALSGRTAAATAAASRVRRGRQIGDRDAPCLRRAVFVLVVCGGHQVLVVDDVRAAAPTLSASSPTARR
jgi:hypothetical protein